MKVIAEISLILLNYNHTLKWLGMVKHVLELQRLAFNYALRNAIAGPLGICLKINETDYAFKFSFPKIYGITLLHK
ncbi:hypothetical protein GKR41_00618 [Candidatus Vallotia lariciata]|nr:hypothetical protein GKR41_00618 [Candidatus Vallotia lariciata]